MATTKKPVVATLTLIVEYEEMPQDSELREILDAARNYGAIERAMLQVHSPLTRDLARDL